MKRLYTYNDVTEEITEEIAKNRSRLIDKVRKEALTPIRQKYKNETDEVISLAYPSRIFSTGGTIPRIVIL